jgi:uncharacterized protein
MAAERLGVRHLTARTGRSALLALAAIAFAGSAPGQDAPSFDCSAVREGSVEELVCDDPALAALDRRLAEVYGQAVKKAVNEHPPTLKAEQRGWWKGRDECWKSDDRRACVEDSYRRRIAELQASYRLVSGTGPVTFFCDGERRNELVVTFFATDPPVLIAERGDSVSLMLRAPSGSGARYLGRNESFRGHQGEARVTWGFGAPEMRCEKADPGEAARPSPP